MTTCLRFAGQIVELIHVQVLLEDLTMTGIKTSLADLFNKARCGFSPKAAVQYAFKSPVAHELQGL